MPPYHRVSGVFRQFLRLHNQVLVPTCSDSCKFSPYVQSAGFTADGLQSRCRNIWSTMRGTRMFLSSSMSQKRLWTLPYVSVVYKSFKLICSTLKAEIISKSVPCKDCFQRLLLFYFHWVSAQAEDTGGAGTSRWSQQPWGWRCRVRRWRDDLEVVLMLMYPGFLWIHIMSCGISNVIIGMWLLQLCTRRAEQMTVSAAVASEDLLDTNLLLSQRRRQEPLTPTKGKNQEDKK